MIFISEQTYLPMVTRIARYYGVDPALVLAHIKQESAFNPHAYRAEPAINDGSHGLMQVLLQTAKTIDPNATVEKLYEPEYNINIGVQYIAKNLARYPEDVKSAIAAYNAGTAYLDENGNYISKSGNTDVQNYVDKVYKNYGMYTDWLNSGAVSVDVMSDPDSIYYGLFLLLSGVAGYLAYKQYVK